MHLEITAIPVSRPPPREVRTEELFKVTRALQATREIHRERARFRQPGSDGHGSKPMVPVWDRCTTPFSKMLVGIGMFTSLYGVLTQGQITNHGSNLRKMGLDPETNILGCSTNLWVMSYNMGDK